MSVDLLNDFSKQVEIEYKDEVYLVRDNGAVYRQSRPRQRRRKLDDEWTFGRQEPSTGYMAIGSHVIHRIVARAFHPQPTPDHIVDHIDTNRANNRAENLRWLTRLENVLLNPITLKRVIQVYGSLDELFENPSRVAMDIPEFGWMRTVSKEEAEASRKRLLKWAESPSTSRGGRLGEWLYRPDVPNEVPQVLPLDVESATPNAVQRNWRTECEFPACPTGIRSNAIAEYAAELKAGSVFSKSKFGEALVEVSGNTDTMLFVVTSMQQDSVKGWALARVEIENGKFVHESLGSFFSRDGAINAFNKELGIDVPHIQTIDDFT